MEGSRRALSRWTEHEERFVLPAIEIVARRLPRYTTQAVWEQLGATFPRSKAIGAKMMDAKRRGWHTQTDDYELSSEAGEHGHAQRLVVWRSLICPVQAELL